jgi:hypothetical protein
MQKYLRLAVLAGTVGALAFAAVAIAGTASLHDGDQNGIKDCIDINTVKASAGNDTSKFGVVMVGSAKANPCKGKAAPEVDIDLDGDKIPNCYVAVGEGEGQTGPPGIFCLHGQSYHRDGGATVKIAKHNNKKWKFKFQTKDIPGHPDSFRFRIYGYVNGDYDDAPDSGGWQKLKIG